MTDLVTRQILQMPLLTAVSPDALAIVQEPDGPMAAVKISALLGRLISVGTAKAVQADLNADLAHDPETIALVYADPNPDFCGWYRKLGASGTGTWSQFERLTMQALTQALAAIDTLTTDGDTQVARLNALGDAIAAVIATAKAQIAALGGVVVPGTTGAFEALIDAAGRVVDQIDAAGKAAPRASVNGRHSNFTASYLGRSSAKTLDASRLRSPQLRAANGVVMSVAPAAMIPELSFLIDYGQSWSLGTQSAAMSLAQPFNDVMFNGGVDLIVGTNIATSCSSLVPMMATAGMEPPTIGRARMARQLLEDEHGMVYGVDSWQAFGVACGQDSQTLPNLVKGGGAGCYANLVALAGAAKARADDASKVIRCRAVSWYHYSPGGVSAQQYVAAVHQLITDLNTDLKATLGQSDNVYLLAFYPPVAVDNATWFSGAWDPIETGPSPFVRIVAPSYPFDHTVGPANGGHVWNIHASEGGNFEKGAYLALAEKRLTIDGSTGPLTVKVIRARRAGRKLVVQLQVPVGPLVFDRDYITAIDQEGIRLTQADRVTDIPVTVSLNPHLNTITLLAAAAIPSTAVLNIAMDTPGGSSATYGRTAGPRSTLRDSQGDHIVFRGNGSPRRMDNYVLPCSIALSVLEAA